MFRATMTLPLLLATVVTASPALPPGYWPEARVDEVLARTQPLRLAPDLSGLTPGEQEAVKHLLAVGELFQRFYEDSRHPQALAARAKLEALDAKGGGKRTKDLLALYRLFQGPIAVTLDNQREPFLPVAPQTPARNVYPPDATREELEAFLAQNPKERDILLGERTLVRRATAANLQRDRAALKRHPALALLHPELAPRLAALAKAPSAKAFYAVPQSVAYADDMVEAYEHLMAAAAAVEADDAELARYLRQRARDLLTDDYEAGDAAWLNGRFKRLNAQIGSYETYDDPLYGTKAFFGLSLLKTNAGATRALRAQLGNLQAIEDALPAPTHKQVRGEIPVGVYDIVADFGQARGTNTATNLPNDPLISRRYGRIILMRANILRSPELFAGSQKVWRAAVQDAHAGELAAEGEFQRTLWHEVGHYLGPSEDERGRPLDAALAEWADALEEMKSDLVSLFSLQQLHAQGKFGAEALRQVQASGVLRTLQNNRPRRDQPYQTMQLAQFNFFLEKGLLVADPQTARLTIRYDRYPETVRALLQEVTALQYGGDQEAAARFFERWGAWKPELHDRIAERIRAAQTVRYRLVRYGALGE